MNATTTTDIHDCPMQQNLGPAINKCHDYLKIAMQDHLNDMTTYKSQTSSESNCYSSEIKKQILAWLKTNNKKPTKMERAFFREELKSNQPRYAHFYLTLKAHKLKPGQMVDHMKRSPIISCPGSLLHGLGLWVDHKLQEVGQKNSIRLLKKTWNEKKQLLELHLPPNACLFTADAVSMYTNIPTHMALNLLSKYLTQHE